MKATPTSLRAPRFLSFLLCQFLGAFNDNAFKVTIVTFALAAIHDEVEQVRFASMATAVLPIPFLLFSPIAGYVSDRLAKHRALLVTKAPEMLAMLIAIFAFQSGDLTYLLVTFFFLATHSAFFSPAKYGLLPEVCKPEDLPMANGILEMTTNLAILSGSVSGVLIYSVFKHDLKWAGVVYLVLAIVGTCAATYLPIAPPGNKNARFAWNLFGSVRDDHRIVKKDRPLFLTMLGIAYFGFLGALFLTIVPVFGKNVLGLAEERAGLLLAVLSIGIGIGSVAAGKLSKGKVELGLVPLGSLGLTIFALDLGLFGATGPVLPIGLPLRATLDLLMIGVSGGFFCIPMKALMQSRAPEGMKGRLIAYSNIQTFTAVLLASGFAWIMTSVVRLSVKDIIIISSALTFLGTGYVFSLLPEFFVRLVLMILTRFFYRLDVKGLDRLPKTGALLVANHVSWVDAILIGAACDRPIRFMMFRPFYEAKFGNWFFKKMGVIPVSNLDPPEKKEESIRMAQEAIAKGDLVCIFAEGAITRTGQLLKFKKGLERIAEAVPEASIVPVYLDGLWGSIFSFESGRILFKKPKSFPYPVTVLFGKKLPHLSKSFEVRRAIQELSIEASFGREGLDALKLLKESFKQKANSKMLGSLETPYASFKSFKEIEKMAHAFAHAEIGDRLGKRERIAVWMPSSEEAIVAHLGIIFSGNVAVQLDWDAPVAIIEEEARIAGVAKVFTGQKRIQREQSPNFSVPLVEIKSNYSGASVKLAEPYRSDEVMNILFNLEDIHPKAVSLSFSNIAENMRGLSQVLQITDEDIILNPMPPSTAIGLLGTLGLALQTGCAIRLGTHVSGSQMTLDATLAVGSSRVLSNIFSSIQATPGKLKAVFVGGEDLDSKWVQEVESKFGTQVLEGFGMLECSGAITVNTLDAETKSGAQKGEKKGSQGRPIPGVALGVYDFEKRAFAGPDQKGLLLVKGPTVVKEGQAAALFEGWYNTGEKASMDEDGFVTLH